MPPQPSVATLSVLAALRARSHLYGLEIARQTNLKAGTLYPIISRLEARGWVEGAWEDIEPCSAGRPRRRFYRLTGAGEVAAVEALAAAEAKLRIAPHPAWTS